MNIEELIPNVEQQDTFAIAFRIEGGACIIETYRTRADLEFAYSSQRKYFSDKGLTTPIPIEKAEGNKWKVLKELCNRQN